MSELNELKRLAGITEFKGYQPYGGSNISITGNEKGELMKKNNIKPGTPEWFKLWFSLPYLTGEKPISESVSYGQMPADAVRVLLHVYEKESEGVEQHRDEEGAKRIGNELNAAAKSLGVSQYMRSLYNSAANSAHMDFDTNPGDFVNWFTYVGNHLKGLYKIHQEKGSYDDDEPDVEIDRD